MDINENLLQINTFTGGMNSDSSPMYLKDNQYRFALNLVLVKTDSESKGELRLVDSIETFITDKDSENATITNLKYITSCREYAILIYEIQVDGYTKWCIGVFTEHSHAITRVFGPCDEALGDTLSCVTRYETEKSIKLYIADGIHLILSINVAKFFTIDNNLQLSSAQSLFTTIDQISNNYNILLSLPQASISSSTGRIIGPKVQYAYVLYKENGGKTTMSPLSSTITLYDTSTGHNEGFAVGESSGVAIDIAIDIAQNQIADKIRLFRISYRASGQDPNIDIVYDDTYSSNSFTFTDIGGEKRSISFAEFTEYQTLDVKPKIIETKDNYLFAGNVQYSQDEVDAEFADFPMDSISILPVVNTTAGQGGQYTLDLNLNVYGSYKKTLIPGEIYKYGIVIYDIHGRKTTVKKFEDIQVANVTDINPLSYSANINSAGELIYCLSNENNALNRYVCTPIGLDVNMHNIPQVWRDKISKIELVRCQKTISNSKILAYGILGSPYAPTNDYLFLSHYLTLNQLRNYSINGPLNQQSDVYIFATPEYTYDDNFLNQIKNIKNSISIHKDYFGFSTGMVLEFEEDTIFHPDYQQSNYVINLPTTVSRYGYIDQSSKELGYPLLSIRPSNPPIEYCGQLNLLNTGDAEISEEIWPYELGFSYPSGGNGTFIKPSIMIMNLIFDSTKNYNPLYYRIRTDSQNGDIAAKITNIECTRYISPFDFLNNSNSNNVTFKGSNTGYTNIEKYTFCNFSAAIVFDAGDPNTNNAFTSGGNIYMKDDWSTATYKIIDSWTSTTTDSLYRMHQTPRRFPDILSGGKYLLFKISSSNSRLQGNIIEYYDDQELSYKEIKCLANIYVGRLTNDAVIYSNDDIYYSTGEFFNSYNYDSDYISYSGDGYLNMYQFNYLHAVEDSVAHPNSFPATYIIPLISRIDLKAISGLLWPFRNNAQNSEFFQDQPVQMQFYKQTKSAYLYNGAYSMDNIAVPYAYVERSSVDSNKNDNRVLYSAKKENGEGIDSWLTFKTNDFIDVDTRFGQITGLKLFADRLLFWQEHAFGILSVNERQMSQSSDGTQIVLGTGGVLDRFDYISTLYGLKLEHLNCICNSNSAVYWWDSYRKQILQYASSKNQYSSKYLIHLMQIDKSINSLVNNTLLGEADGESTNPSIHYDINNRNVLFSLFNMNSLIYSEDFDVFTSVLDYVFKGNTTINGKSYFVGEYNKVETYLNEDPLREVIYKYTFYPRVIFYVNKQYQYNKVFDNTTYYGDILDNNNKDYLRFTYSTPSGQLGQSNGSDVTDREMEYRMAIPRQLKLNGDKYEWGGRLRGKYLETKIWVAGPQQNFSLQYVITKFRISYV